MITYDVSVTICIYLFLSSFPPSQTRSYFLKKQANNQSNKQKCISCHYVCVGGGAHQCEDASRGQYRTTDPLELKTPDISAGNQTVVLCKSNKYSKLLSHFSSPCQKVDEEASLLRQEFFLIGS